MGPAEFPVGVSPGPQPRALGIAGSLGRDRTAHLQRLQEGHWGLFLSDRAKATCPAASLSLGRGITLLHSSHSEA